MLVSRCLSKPLVCRDVALSFPVPHLPCQCAFAGVSHRTDMHSNRESRSDGS
jgi:hypothetical protein